MALEPHEWEKLVEVAQDTAATKQAVEALKERIDNVEDDAKARAQKVGGGVGAAAGTITSVVTTAIMNALLGRGS